MRRSSSLIFPPMLMLPRHAVSSMGIWSSMLRKGNATWTMYCRSVTSLGMIHSYSGAS